MGADDKSRFLRHPAPGSHFEFLCECETIVEADFVPALWMTASAGAADLSEHPEISAWRDRWRPYLVRQDEGLRAQARDRLLARGAPAEWLESAGGSETINEIVAGWRLRLLIADENASHPGSRKRASPTKPALDGGYKKRISQDVIYSVSQVNPSYGPKALADWLNTGATNRAISRLTSDHVSRALAARFARVGGWFRDCVRAGLDRDAMVDLVARSDFDAAHQIKMFLRAYERSPSFGLGGLKGAALARAIHSRFDLCAAARRLENKNSALLAA